MITFLNFVSITGIDSHLQGHSIRIYELLKMSTYTWRYTEKKKIALLKILVWLISDCFLKVKMRQSRHNK